MYKKVIQVRDKYKLMESILKYKTDRLFVSFEGRLQDYDFNKIDGIICEENSPIKRNVIEPKSDFYVFDLNYMNVDRILKVLKIEDLIEWDIFHIKISNSYETVFESYDWFSDCYLNSGFYNSTFISNLINNKIIEFV